VSYAVKELFYTLQGEGMQAGRAAVFCRFTGCNLWSGREQDRATAACTFCDTDFVGTDGEGGGRFKSARELSDAIASTWAAVAQGGRPLVVCTGGEPLLQLDQALVDELHRTGFEVAVETNGTQEAPEGLDHICVSPKGRAPLSLSSGHELKLVYPQLDAPPERFEGLDFERFYLQPMDGPKLREHTQQSVAYCLEHPLWRLSVQTHKVVGIP